MSGNAARASSLGIVGVGGSRWATRRHWDLICIVCRLGWRALTCVIGPPPLAWAVTVNFCHNVLTLWPTFSHNVLFNGPRAGVNFNDGFGGGEMDCRLLQSRCKTTWSGSGKA